MEKRLSKSNQVSLGQIAFVLLAVLTVGKLFYLPSLMYNAVGRDSVITAGILVVANWVMLLVTFALIRKSGEKNISDLLTVSFGKVAGKIILGLLAVFFLLQFVLPVAELYSFLNFVTMQKSSYLAFIIPLGCLLWFMAQKGLTTIARNAEIFAPLVLIAALVLFGFSVPAADAENLLPLGAGDMGGTLLGVIKFFGWFSDCALFLMFIGKSKAMREALPENNARKKLERQLGGAGLLFTSVLASALIIAFFVLFSAVFGAATGSQTFALSRISEFGTSNFLGHGDRAAVTVWLFGSILKMGLTIYAASECVSLIFNIKKEKAKGITVAALLVAGAILPVAFGLDFVIRELFGTTWFLCAAAFFSVLLPIYLLIFAARKPMPKLATAGKSEKSANKKSGETKKRTAGTKQSNKNKDIKEGNKNVAK